MIAWYVVPTFLSVLVALYIGFLALGGDDMPFKGLILSVFGLFCTFGLGLIWGGAWLCKVLLQ